MFNPSLMVYLSVMMCRLFSIYAVRDYLGRESEAKRQCTMNYDGWNFFAVKVNFLHCNYCISVFLDQELIPYRYSSCSYSCVSC